MTLSPMRNAALARLRAAPGHPDRHAQQADARTALCLTLGVAIEDITPASGHDISWEAYLHIRESWVRLLGEDGDSPWVRRNCLEAERCWARRRPEYLERLPWPAPSPACDTCGTPESAWDVRHPLHLEGSHQCPLCREADCADEADYKRRTDV